MNILITQGTICQTDTVSQLLTLGLTMSSPITVNILDTPRGVQAATKPTNLPWQKNDHILRHFHIYTYFVFSSASNHAIICFIISAWALTAGLKEHITMIIIKVFYCANSCPKTVLREYIHAHMVMYTIHNLPSL